jgi:hypothetical protein
VLGQNIILRQTLIPRNQTSAVWLITNTLKSNQNSRNPPSGTQPLVQQRLFQAMMGADRTFTNYKGPLPVVCLLSSIVAGRLLHQLAAVSGTWLTRFGAATRLSLIWGLPDASEGLLGTARGDRI